MCEPVRCSWCNLKNINYVNYHDLEWGRPLYEDQKLYENDYLTPFWGSDGSAPTIRATSHEEFQVTEAAMEEYLDLIRRAKSETKE